MARSSNDSSVANKQLRMSIDGQSATMPISKLELPLQRDDDGSLPGAALRYIRGCMEEALNQIWGPDKIDNQCEQRNNSPVCELAEANDEQNVNFIVVDSIVAERADGSSDGEMDNNKNGNDLE